jgi:hypothetical protein
MTSTITGRQFVVSILLRVGLIGIVIILLLAGSVGQARSAGAQQDKPTFTIYSRELHKKGYVCVGEKIHIIVRALTAQKPKPNLVVLKHISGFPVTALVTSGTGTVIPDKAWLGFDSMVPEGAEFVFEAKKTGKEKIFFEALVPDVFFATPDVYLEQPLEFEVKNCKHRVNLILDGQLSDEGVFWSGIGLIEDAIIEQGEDGVYRGSAEFEFNVFNHATTDGSCVYQPHTAISQAEITGQPNEQVMTWTLTYQDAQESVTATCADVGTQTFDNLQPLSEYGPSVVAISSSGGAARYHQSWSWPTGGEFATYTIIVEPVEAKSVSRTGDPARLPGWFEAALFLP